MKKIVPVPECSANPLRDARVNKGACVLFPKEAPGSACEMYEAHEFELSCTEGNGCLQRSH